jgi:AP endonuclease-1
MPPKRGVEGMAESPRASKRKELAKSEDIVRKPPISAPKRSSRAKAAQTEVAISVKSESTKVETKIEETKVNLEAVEQKQVANPRKRRELEETARPGVKQEIAQETILPTVKDNKKRKAGLAKTKEESSDSEADAQPKKKALKRKTKEEKEAEAMPLAARTTGLRMFVGAHVSIAKGVQNAVANSVHIG